MGVINWPACSANRCSVCRDPAMRWVVGDRAIAGSAASASQMGRFETSG
jgi:hypothetical protein